MSANTHTHTHALTHIHTHTYTLTMHLHTYTMHYCTCTHTHTVPTDRGEGQCYLTKIFCTCFFPRLERDCETRPQETGQGHLNHQYHLQHWSRRPRHPQSFSVSGIGLERCGKPHGSCSWLPGNYGLRAIAAPQEDPVPAQRSAQHTTYGTMLAQRCSCPHGTHTQILLYLTVSTIPRNTLLLKIFSHILALPTVSRMA